MVERPNFLFLFPDQWRSDCLEFLGHGVVETPFLNDLASEGTTFTAAYTPSPSCIPARACLVTGMTPSSTGRLGYRDGVPWRYPHTLMRCLRDGGYQTLLAGKNHFYPQRAALGFEEMQIYETIELDPGFRSDYHRWLEHETNGVVRDTADELNANAWAVQPWTAPERLHPNTWTVDTAIDMLARRDPTRPFFLQVGFHRPHPPFDPPLHYLERFQDRPLPPVPVGDWATAFDHPVEKIDTYSGRLHEHVLDRTRRAYYAQVAHLDYQIGRLMLALKKRGLREDTYIVFSSDHGELLGDHHLFRKFNPFEGSAKVPLIIRPPPSWDAPRGVSNDLPVSLCDLMPTFLAEAGLAVPEAVEGSSLAPLVRGESPTWRDFVHGEHTRADRGWQFVTDGKEKFIWDSKSGEEWFFNLSTDSEERVNRISDPTYKDRVALWRRRLVGVLAQRPRDGLSDGERLIPGKIAPTVRPELLEGEGRAE